MSSRGGEVKPAAAAAALDLIDQNGSPFTFNDVKGNVFVVYFGYTTCPDLCPTTLSDFTAVKAGLGEKASRVRFGLVTVDPDRDTPERLKKYLGFFDPEFVGLSGNAEQTAAVERNYGVIAKRVDYPGTSTGYLMDHTSIIYIIDPNGRLRVTFQYGADPKDIVADIEHLL
jgi:protein SCO1